MASITNDVIDVLVKLDMVQSNSGGGVAPSLRKATDASGNPVLLGADGVGVAIGRHPATVVISPSGDTTGATDHAAVNAYTSIGVSVHLAAGEWYFNDTIHRGFLRDAAGLLVARAPTMGPGSLNSVVGDMTGDGAGVTRLNFLDATKPGIEFWERTVQDDGTTAYRDHTGVAGYDYPIAWGGGVTKGFRIIGQMPAPALLGSVADAVTVVHSAVTYPKFANHIGILVWGACGDHLFENVTTDSFGVGRVLHDATLMKFIKCPINACDIGEAHAIQWDLNQYDGCQIRDCRFGSMMEWNGILKDAGGWVKFPRESAGSVMAGVTGTTGQANTYRNCAWTGQKFSAIAGADVDNNTALGRMFTNKFDGCYWESNATDYFLTRNGSQGQHVFQNCFFADLDYADAKLLRTNAALQAKWGVSQTTINNSFGQFWNITNATSDTSFVVENCQLYPTPYGFMPRLNLAQLYWKNNYILHSNGYSIQPSAAPAGEDANILTTMGYRGICVTDGDWFPLYNATAANIEETNLRDFYINAGFVHERDRLPRRVDTTTALPTAAANRHGQIRVVSGGAGVADTVQVCVKDAADAYGWKTVTIA